MERRNPITYPSLGCIIHYLSPLKRIFDISRINGSMNSRFPYRINHLVLGESSFSIDGLKFSYRISRERNNLYGVRYDDGLPYDVLENGQRDPDWALAPGDVFIESQALTGPPSLAGRERDRIIIKCIIEHKLNRRTIRILHLPVGTKLRDALRSNIAYFLGRNRVHQVVHLEVGISEGVLRLPVGLKFHIRQLSLPMRGAVVLEAIRPKIIFGTLQKLTVTVESRQDPILATDLFRLPESVHVRLQKLDDPLKEFIFELPHKKIRVSGKEFNHTAFSRVFNTWKQRHPEVGTEFGVHVRDIDRYTKNLKYWLQFQPATWDQNSFRRFTVQLDDRRHVCGYVLGAQYDDDEVRRNQQPMLVLMRVENFVRTSYSETSV